MVKIENPVRDIDPVNHQIGKSTAAEIPKPAPVPEPVCVERLLRHMPQKALPIHALRIHLRNRPAPVRIPVPGQMHLVYLTQLTRAGNVWNKSLELPVRLPRQSKLQRHEADSAGFFLPRRMQVSFYFINQQNYPLCRGFSA